jgi:hypothetical protein
MCSYCFLERPNKKMYLIENLGIKKIERRWSGGKFYGDNKGIIINASFENISVNYLHRKENRSWLVGVNLRTFWEYGGIYPTREEILKTAGSMTVEGETLDLAPHNIILNNKALHLIDQKRKDSVCTKEKMMSYLTSFSKGRATGSY